jgi:hypothetical protein
MILDTPVRLDTPKVTAPAAVHARQAPLPHTSIQRPIATANANLGTRAAVLHLGTQAVELAQGPGMRREEAASRTHGPATNATQTNANGEATQPPPLAPAAASERQLAPESHDSADQDREAPTSNGDRKALGQLQQRDAEVRSSENAHQSAGGQYAGPTQFAYQVGPDGQSYAVGGATSIDVSPVQGDPAATLRKMDVVQRAASAQASPSGADRQVAAQAAQHAAQARAELAARRYSAAQALGTEER